MNASSPQFAMGVHLLPFAVFLAHHREISGFPEPLSLNTMVNSTSLIGCVSKLKMERYLYDWPQPIPKNRQQRPTNALRRVGREAVWSLSFKKWITPFRWPLMSK